jgi:hypothetical protein
MHNIITIWVIVAVFFMILGGLGIGVGKLLGSSSGGGKGPGDNAAGAQPGK